MQSSKEMTVVKRNGNIEIVSFDKILNRVKSLGKNIKTINYTNLVIKVIDQLYDGILTTQIDELTGEQCASLITTNPDYGNLGCRIIISNHHKNTLPSFTQTMAKLFNDKDFHKNTNALISNELYQLSQKYSDQLENAIDYERDYLIDYFGFKTLERSYLFKINNITVERPQHMWMRVSLGIHGDNLEKVLETYHLLSQKYFTHATPTLFNAGTPRPQNSSCYLLAMESDSIDGIYNTLKDCALISKWSGGIGLHIHNIRCAGSQIRGTNGISDGVVPMLRVFNSTARYVDQGGGKRKGSFAIYIEPWHGDILSILDIKKNSGDEEQKCRDLFFALWTPNLFMERVKSDENWSLFCPDQCPGLSDCYGDAFKTLYEQYERDGKAIKTMRARELWYKVLDSQMETGGPYILYKDACNEKSNQKNVGVIKSSNLCTEIIQYSSPEETAVCNLASIGLSKFVYQPTHSFKLATLYSKSSCSYCKLAKALLTQFNIEINEINLDNDVERHAFYEAQSQLLNKPINSVPFIELDNMHIGGWSDLRQLLKMEFDYEQLHKITKVITCNLNNIIDVNYYPTEKTRLSNMLHRPIGIGVQGLADVFCLMDIAYHSEEAKEINKNIFETIYHASVEQSMELAKNRKEIIEFYLKTQHINYEKIISFNTHNKGKKLDKPLNKLFIHENNHVNVAELTKLTKQHCGSYSSFEDSPASKGQLQFDMWGVTPTRYDWNTLKKDVMEHGMRNSLLVAPMPTASTSQILGNNECFEPFTSNIYTRRTLAGEFIMVNKYLINDLIHLNYWNDDIKNNIIQNKGSVQQLNFLPTHIKNKYKIVWEIPMKHMIDMAKDRGPFICQSQSLNLWQEDPNYKSLTNMHMYAYNAGLKTGIYYLRRKPKHQPQQFTIAPTIKQNDSLDDICEMCSG